MPRVGKFIHSGRLLVLGVANVYLVRNDSDVHSKTFRSVQQQMKSLLAHTVVRYTRNPTGKFVYFRIPYYMHLISVVPSTTISVR
jgi:hypothetical protein